MFSTSKLKRLFLGAAWFAAAGWAQAYTFTVVPQSNWANINFSESSNVGALSVGWYPISAKVEALPGATVTRTSYGYAPSAVDVLLSAPISGVTLDVNPSSQLKATQLTLSGGLSLTIGSDHSEISNLSIDLVNKQVRGDIRAGDVVQKGISVWSIDNVQGPDAIPALACDFTCDIGALYLTDGYLQNRYLNQLTLTGLRMTKQATELILPGLSASPWAAMYSDYLKAADWDNHITFSTLTVVPEAGTSLMMLVGLGGLGVVGAAKKRARQ